MGKADTSLSKTCTHKETLTQTDATVEVGNHWEEGLAGVRGMELLCAAGSAHRLGCSCDLSESTYHAGLVCCFSAHAKLLQPTAVVSWKFVLHRLHLQHPMDLGSASAGHSLNCCFMHGLNSAVLSLLLAATVAKKLPPTLPPFLSSTLLPPWLFDPAPLYRTILSLFRPCGWISKFGLHA